MDKTNKVEFHIAARATDAIRKDIHFMTRQLISESAELTKGEPNN